MDLPSLPLFEKPWNMSDGFLLPCPSFSLQRLRHIMYASSLLCSKRREAAAMFAAFPKNPRVCWHASSLPLFEKSSQLAHVFVLLSAPELKHVCCLHSFNKQRLLSHGSALRAWNTLPKISSENFYVRHCPFHKRLCRMRIEGKETAGKCI